MIRHDLESTRIITIARGTGAEDLIPLSHALFRGGIRLLEVTMNTPDAAEAIRELVTEWGGEQRSVLQGKSPGPPIRTGASKDLHIGAGTVTTLALAKQAVAAGASFLVTPNVNPQVIDYALKRRILVIPGAYLPTEITLAQELGCEYIKLFPAGSAGPEHLKHILAPYDRTKLIAVGGVNLENARSFVEAGAFGLGVGSDLVKVPEDGDYGAVEERAREYVGVFG